jgi:antitoxin component YwqK of YwqJK toxin-antitoxin module
MHTVSMDDNIQKTLIEAQKKGYVFTSIQDDWILISKLPDDAMTKKPGQIYDANTMLYRTNKLHIVAIIHKVEPGKTIQSINDGHSGYTFEVGKTTMHGNYIQPLHIMYENGFKYYCSFVPAYYGFDHVRPKRMTVVFYINGAVRYVWYPIEIGEITHWQEIKYYDNEQVASIITTYDNFMVGNCTKFYENGVREIECDFVVCPHKMVYQTMKKKGGKSLTVARYLYSREKYGIDPDYDENSKAYLDYVLWDRDDNFSGIHQNGIRDGNYIVRYESGQIKVKAKYCMGALKAKYEFDDIVETPEVQSPKIIDGLRHIII